MKYFTVVLFMPLVLSGQQAPPEPFLTLPVEKFTISEAWEYDKEVQVHPDITTHYAVDFQTKWGTPVRAAADGWAIHSFQTFYLDKPYQGKRTGYGLGHFVQLYHLLPGREVFTLYAHLSRVAEDIPYFPAKEEHGLFSPEVVYLNFQDVLKSGFAAGEKTIRPVFVRRGQIIGYVGDTGLSWQYEEQPETERNRKQLKSWDKPHLHFEVYSRREDAQHRFMKVRDLRWDPYGLKAKAAAYKPGSFGSRHLWLLGKNSQPLFVK